MKLLDDLSASIKRIEAKLFGEGAAAPQAAKGKAKEKKADGEGEDPGKGEEDDDCDMLAEAHGLLAKAKVNVTSLSAALEKAQGEVNAHGATIKAASDRINTFLSASKLAFKPEDSLQDRLEKALSASAETLVKQGVDLSQVPAAAASSGLPENKGGVSKQYAEMVSKDPLAASSFYAANAEKILRGE